MFTTYAATQIFNNSLGKTNTISLASTCYLAFSTTTPSVDGTNVTEPSAAANYERILLGSSGQSLTQLMGVPAASISGDEVTVSNVETIKSNRASASWGTITHICIYNAKTGGNLIAFEALTSPITVESGASVHFNKGELTLTLK